MSIILVKEITKKAASNRLSVRKKIKVIVPARCSYLNDRMMRHLVS